MELKIHRGENHPKAWGTELWIHNSEKYCGKILKFKQGARFSNHFHIKKLESWFILNGRFQLNWIDTDTAKHNTSILCEGDAVDVPIGCPHQLICLESGSIAEFSSQHFENDSYRIFPGDSQTTV